MVPVRLRPLGADQFSDFNPNNSMRI